MLQLKGITKMDIRQLKYFLTIAEEGSITAAAKKLSMAQPPLSQQLKQLEEELGVKLMERGARNIQLTDAGIILQNRAKQIIALNDSAAREVRDVSTGLSGTLSIGTVSSSAATLLKERLTFFHQQYPDVTFEIHEGNTFMMIDLLNKGIVEIGIVRTPFNVTNLNYTYAETEPMVAVMTAAHDWDEQNVEIGIEELEGRPLIIYRRFEQLITNTCHQYNFQPTILCKNDDARTTLLWANAGLGIGILPKSAVYALTDRNDLRIKIIQEPALHTRIAAIWDKDRYLSSVARKFIECFSSDIVKN